MVLLCEVKLGAFEKKWWCSQRECKQSYQFFLTLVSTLYTLYIDGGNKQTLNSDVKIAFL